MTAAGTIGAVSEDEATTAGDAGPEPRPAGEERPGDRGPSRVVVASADAPADGAQKEPSGELTEEERRRRARGIVALAIVIGAVVALMAVGGSMLTGFIRREVPQKSEKRKETTTAAPTTVPKPPALTDGMSCQELVEAGVEYANVVAYWLRTGSPRTLDKDRDGVPCNDVYDEGVVDDFSSLAGSLPKKASCQDLVDSSVLYPDVVAYWLRRDRTSKLMAEGADWPCTDVYPPQDVDAFVKFDS